ncbi:response regulator transcription factor [Streptomyces olivochromogenes]|uniref:response regulator transcription factor n=1 Tax=Streptomyces olivochromogenes TaxID=1963 RepID=UPI001F223E3F|nr:response regulator transcription factor [Streptomyces olivochromogenes]MCF3131686.1 response regulator transcription factor [Streptomyces olivochromogenes]
MLFDGKPDLEVSGDAGDIPQIASSVSDLRPDVVVIDSETNSLDAAEVVRFLGSEAPGSPSLALVGEFDDQVQRLLRAGVRGLLLNRSSPVEIVSAVRLVAAGYALLFPCRGRRLVDWQAPADGDKQEARHEALRKLTRREVDVLRLIARGCSNAEIAEMLFVSESTVKSHVQRMLDKLELRNRIHAVIYAYEIGMVRTAGPSARIPVSPVG